MKSQAIALVVLVAFVLMVVSFKLWLEGYPGPFDPEFFTGRQAIALEANQSGASISASDVMVVPSVAPALSAAPIPEEGPRWRRRYVVTLPRNIKMTVEMRTYGAIYRGPADRYNSSQLTQPGGRWVLFDITAPADKILDPVLLPLVEEAARAILAQDAAFMATRRTQFVDETGVIWTSDTKEKTR